MVKGINDPEADVNIFNMIKSISNFRNNKMNYINRYIVFIILYFMCDFIGGSYEYASLGFLATFGGVILAPMMFIAMYFFASILVFWVNVRHVDLGFKTWIKEWHSFNLSIGTLFYDIVLLLLVVMLFTGGLKPI